MKYNFSSFSHIKYRDSHEKKDDLIGVNVGHSTGRMMFLIGKNGYYNISQCTLEENCIAFYSKKCGNQTHMSNIFQYHVYTLHGKYLGSIEDIVFDESWRIQDLYVIRHVFFVYPLRKIIPRTFIRRMETGKIMIDPDIENPIQKMKRAPVNMLPV